jgi:hypothetical protein
MSFVIKQPTWWLAIVSIGILIVEENRERRRTHQEKQVQIASKLKELAQDFRGRFVPNSSAYSIFRLVDDMRGAKPEEKEYLAWAQGCNLGRDFLTYWATYLIERLSFIIESKPSQRKELSERFEEFRCMNHSYFQLVRAFREKANVLQIPKNLEDEYNKFVTEYNEFVRNLRNTVAEASGVLHLSVDPKSIEFADELHPARWG